MNVTVPLRRITVVIAAVSTMAVAGGCGGNIEGTGGDSAGAQSSFPASQFSPSTYKGLKGPVTVYDTDGGAQVVGKSQTIYRNFTRLTGVPVTSDFNSDTTKFFAAMQSGKPMWNVIEFPTVGDYLHAKKLGLVQKLDPAIVPLHKLQPGSYDDYGYRAEQYGIVLGWNTKKFPSSGPHPSSWKDFFDTKRFPGKRCMFKYPEFGATLEAPLLADGVPPSRLYPLDVPRAFAKLNTIKRDIVWWDSGGQAIQYLANGQCAMGVVWSARVFVAVTQNHLPVDFTWNQALYTSAVLAVPKNAPNGKAAQALLSMWIDDKEGQRKLVSTVLPYPTMIKGLTYPASVTKWLPLGENLKQAVAEDDKYYAANIDQLSKRFTAWLGGS